MVEVASEIGAASRELCRIGPAGAAIVAVRSSATVEDAASSSFAGTFSRFLNVSGPPVSGD